MDSGQLHESAQCVCAYRELVHAQCCVVSVERQRRDAVGDALF